MRKTFCYLVIPTLLYLLSCGNPEQDLPGATSTKTNIKKFEDLVDYRDISLDSLKKIMAVVEQPIILYFSGFADVNSRKLEEELFMEAQQNGQLNTQTMVMFMVDDRNPLPENEKYISPVTGDSITHYGKRSAELEIKLGKNYQPWFVKVDDHFKILDSLTYIDRERSSDFFGK